MPKRRKSKTRRGVRRGNSIFNKDNIIMSGTETFFNVQSSSTSANTPINGTGNAVSLNPSVLSNRIVQVSDAYSRYRFKYIKVSYVSHCSSTTQGALALGIVDDSSNSDNTGNINTYTAITNLRCNKDGSLWKNFTFVWRPVDPKKWYYTDTAGEDVRFVQQGTLLARYDVARMDNVLLGDVRLQYIIEFEGGRPVFVNNLASSLQSSAEEHPEVKVENINHKPGLVVTSPPVVKAVSVGRNKWH